MYFGALNLNLALICTHLVIRHPQYKSKILHYFIHETRKVFVLEP